jgi:hypothetical protein
LLACDRRHVAPSGPASAFSGAILGLGCPVLCLCLGRSRVCAYRHLLADGSIAESIELTKVDFGAFPEADVMWTTATASALGSARFSPSAISGVVFIAGIAICDWRMRRCTGRQLRCGRAGGARERRSVGRSTPAS